MELKLTNTSLVALIDEEDFERVSKLNWCIRYNDGKPYVQARKGYKNFTLHRFVMKLLDDDIRRVDHKNNDGLDNRKNNLRLADRSQNAANSGKRCNNKSGYKGVAAAKTRGIQYGWRVDIAKWSKKLYLGIYYDIIEAAKVYDAKAIEFFGEFAGLNFPNSYKSVEAKHWPMNLNLF